MFLLGHIDFKNPVIVIKETSAGLKSSYETSPNVLKSNKKNLLDYSMELVIKHKREIHTLLSQFLDYYCAKFL